MARTLGCISEPPVVTRSGQGAQPSAGPGFALLLPSHRCTHVPALDASLESHVLAHRHFRLDVTRNRNVVSDDGLGLRSFETRGQTHRPLAVVVLAGRLRLAQAGAVFWAKAGEIALLPSRAALSLRREGRRFESLAVEWDAGTLGGFAPSAPRVKRVSPRHLAQLGAGADRIASESPDHPVGAPAFGGIVVVLRGAGVLPRTVGKYEFVAAVPRRSLQLSRVLDRLLSDLSERPMLVDLERATGMCPRHIHRMVASFHACYGFDASGWRDALNRRRLLVASALMTAPAATVAVVAAATGYGSRAALWRAFASAKLPPPTALALAARDVRKWDA